MNLDIPTSLPFLALYAETHFRFFRGFPSLIYMREPEVIFDAPARLGPGEDLPIALIVNDTGRFPAFLSDCAVAVSREGTKTARFDFPEIESFEISHPFSSNSKAYLFTIPRSRLPSGRIFVNAVVTMQRGRRRSVILNDNLRTSNKTAFSCYVSEHPLPGSEFCSYGDLHTHSVYSQSHVEFGPPIRVIDAMARAGGLDFTAVTDHSYDLSCSMEDYLRDDPGGVRWRTFLEEMDGDFDTVMIPGEEISVLNGLGEVVHLCALNCREFIPGTLDGARKNREKDPQTTLAEAIDRIHAAGGLAFAAHPGASAGFLQRLFLRRGEWSEADCDMPLDGMQVYNSGFDSSFDKGLSLWLSMLRRGRFTPPLAGNDAHGDFSRYRALATPFLSVKDNGERYFGKGKTGVYGGGRSPQEIIAAIEDGRTFITTGPFVNISISPHPDEVPSATRADGSPLFLHAISTPEFGGLQSMTLFGGKSGDPDETMLFRKKFDGNTMRACEKTESSGRSVDYVRAEVVTVNGARALTRALSL